MSGLKRMPATNVSPSRSASYMCPGTNPEFSWRSRPRGSPNIKWTAFCDCLLESLFFNDLLWTSKGIPRRSEIAQLWIQILNLTDRKSRRPVKQPDHGYIIRLRWLLVSFTSTLFLYKHPRTVTGVWLNQPSQLRSFEIYSPTTMSHSGGSNKNCYSVGLASQLQNHLLQFGIAQKCDLLGETVQLILGYFHESNLRFPPITSSRL